VAWKEQVMYQLVTANIFQEFKIQLLIWVFFTLFLSIINNYRYMERQS